MIRTESQNCARPAPACGGDRSASLLLDRPRRLDTSGPFYHSAYGVPSRPVAGLLEKTSNTFWPPPPCESGSSCSERVPQSALPVIGSTGILRRNRYLALVFPRTGMPSIRALRSGGYPKESAFTGIMPRSEKFL